MRARGALRSALAAGAGMGALLGVVTLGGLLIEGLRPGLGQRAAAQPGVPVWPAGERPAGPDGCCRWELATLVPFERNLAPREQVGAPGWAIEAFPPVVLLDQCSGRTWTLEFRAGPGGHDWRLLRRQGID